MKRLSLFVITIVLVIFYATGVSARECTIGQRSIPNGIEGLEKAWREARSGNCTSDDIKWRKRYGEFYPGTTQFQIIRFDRSANLSFSEPLDDAYSNDDMPVAVVADEDVDVTISGNNVRCAFVLKGKNIIIDHLTIKDFKKAAVIMEGARHLIIRSRLVSNDENGVLVTGKDNRIVDSEIAQNGINGVLLGGDSASGGCSAILSDRGRGSKIMGGHIHDNGRAVSGVSCADLSSPDSYAGCRSLKLEVEGCYGILDEQAPCEEPNVPMDDACGRYWISRHRCSQLWRQLGENEDAQLDEVIGAMYEAHPGAQGGNGVFVDAPGVRITSWHPAEETEIVPLFEGGIYQNQSHDVYVNTMTPAAVCQDSDVAFDLGLVHTALVSETPVGYLTISRFPLPVISQLASTSGVNEITVSGTVRLSDEPAYLWNDRTVSYTALKGEVFIKSQDTGLMGFAGSAPVDNAGRFVVRLTPPLTIEGVTVTNPVFIATVVDTEHGNTSPFLGAHTASPDADDDSDGLTNGQEDLNQNGVVDALETDPLNPDTDADGLMDGEERAHNGRVGELMDQGFVFAALDRLDPLNPDSDNDCLPDGLELGVTKQEVETLISQMPAKPRFWVSSPCRKILDDSPVTAIENAIWYDSIASKLWNNISMLFDLDPETLTDPTSADTDRDGTLDGAEDTNFNGRRDETDQLNGVVDHTEIDPAESDSDGDGIVDGEEGDRDGDGKIGPDESDPLLYDTDGDGVGDGQEKRIGTYPNACDSDEDGLSDGVEEGAIQPASSDSGCHGLQAAGTNYQNPHILNPLNPDSDNDGRLDGAEDENGNGWVDTFESDPSLDDTDRDGLLDGIEAKGDFDGDNIPDFDLRLITAGPKCSPPEDISDIDCDGIPNWVDIDSDEDGCPDSEEGGRKDLNANGVPDVFDNEAKGCGAGGGGGSVSFSGSGGSTSDEEAAPSTGSTPSWLKDVSGGGACNLVPTIRNKQDISSSIILIIAGYLFVLSMLIVRIKCRRTRN